MTEQILTQELVKELLHYNPDTGVVTRRVAIGRKKSGSVFGCLSKTHAGKSYLRQRLYGKKYRVHRIIWLYMTGVWPIEIDHDDGNGLNNRWDNIRNVTQTENSKNHRLQKNNTSNHVGVSWLENRKKWEAYVYNGRKIGLGQFTDWFEAVCARKSAENKYGFHPNHGTIRPL